MDRRLAGYYSPARTDSIPFRGRPPIRPGPMTPLSRFLLIPVCVFALAAQSGCVSRRLTIRSDPPGALVEVDGKRLGQTPVSTDFTYYGTREITLSMPGYETLTVQQPVPRPCYQTFPFDFFSNHFSPVHVTDRHDFTYRLTPRVTPIDEESSLINRGRNFRSQSQVSGP
ncbi:PEGA domain-containing protein [Planctomicrobium sp. SH664]|uniref:PEGA domain-containing protein n=1 Tax=Planctomicrobium sp. SH664 TaxID=3448125 RepID=UPI003F5B8A8A